MDPAPHARSTPALRVAVLAALLTASVLVGRLAAAVLTEVAAGQDAETLARALPGALGRMVAQYAGAPLVPALVLAVVPWGVAAAARVLAALARARASALERALLAGALVSMAASASALLAHATGVKQGMAALGYALGWPAVLVLTGVMWSSAWPTPLVCAAVSALCAGGWFVRLLPVGWPGENSLSFWAMLPHVPKRAALLALGGVGAAMLLAHAAMRRTRLAFALRLACAVAAMAILLRVLPAFEHYGAEKHEAVLASDVSTSYLEVAAGISDPRVFVRGYVAAMPGLPMHARTHPPTWPLLFRAAVDAAPARAAAITQRALGARAADAAQLTQDFAQRTLSDAEHAGAWALVGAFALGLLLLPLAAAWAAWPLGGRDAAAMAAGLCVLVPGPLFYFPQVDVSYPLLAMLALGAWLRRAQPLAALAAGVLVAALTALSIGNLSLVLPLLLVVLAGRGERPLRHELVPAALLLAPLVVLAALAAAAGLPPFALVAEALHQHRVILAHRTRALWVALHPLEFAVTLGPALAVTLARGTEWRVAASGLFAGRLRGATALGAALLASLVVLDLSGTTKGESGRLWLAFAPMLAVAGAPRLVARGEPLSWLVAASGVLLVLLKGFYAFVWL